MLVVENKTGIWLSLWPGLLITITKTIKIYLALMLVTAGLMLLGLVMLHCLSLHLTLLLISCGLMVKLRRLKKLKVTGSWR